MKHLLVLVLLITSFCKPVWSQEVSVQEVIESQLLAFSKDDFDQAFEFASPSIQGFFGSSERFGQMVRQGYPMVLRQKAFEFKESQQDGPKAVQDLLVEDLNGDFHLLRYELVLLEGQWKIAGVQKIPTGIVST